MYKYEYGFIGTGNMGAALSSALNSASLDAFPVALSNRTLEKAEKLALELNISADRKFLVTSNEDIAENAHFIMLGVKPQMFPEVIDNIKGILLNREEKVILVTMAAGISMETLSEMVGREVPIIRIMPNTPLSINQGVILASHNEMVSSDEMDFFVSSFSAAGKIHEMDESLIDAGSVVSGCGPAYAYMFIEAMAKAGVNLGLSEELSTSLAIETIKGAAALSEVSDKSLEELRVAVCSPGGSTIEGVKSFWDSNLDSVVENALSAAYNRTLELGGKK